jgi:capsular polysaccharide biosynthesis protein
MNPLPTNNFDSGNLLDLIIKWRKHLIIVGVAAILISAAASFMITPKYKSSVIMFPAQTSSIAKAIISENNNGKDDILKFGEEEDAEQMLQILNSDDIRGRVCQKYNLMNHYGIDSTAKYKNTLLFKEYEDNIKFERTEFMSVKITVLDKEPKMAAAIANDIAALLDSTKNKMQRARASEGLKIVGKAYWDMIQETNRMNDSLDALRRLGINDYETQASVYNEQYAIAIAKGNMSGARSLEEKLKVLSQYGGAYVSIRDKMELQIKQLQVMKIKYEEAKVDAEQTLPHKFIVNRAYESEKKAYPIRWLIVVSSTLATLFFALLAILLLENLQKRKNK